MSLVNKSLISFRLRYYAHFLQNFTALLTYQSAVYYIEFFAQYVMCKYSEEYTKNVLQCLTGYSSVRKVSKSNILYNIVKLRNAIVHCDTVNIKLCIEAISEADLNEELSLVTDSLVLDGMQLVKDIDMDGFCEYLLSY